MIVNYEYAARLLRLIADDGGGPGRLAIATDRDIAVACGVVMEEVERLRLDARKSYHADGTWILRETPEEVIRYRIECAAALDKSRNLPGT